MGLSSSERRTDTVEQSRIQEAIAEILRAIGEDSSREGLKNTPERVSRMYETLFSGVGINPVDAIDAIFKVEHHDPVVLRNLNFYSVCEHHLLPFFGEAKVAYIPNGKIAGISKLARALDIAARRPHVQERLTSAVADAIFGALNPDGVIVELEAEHLCMSMRGIQKPAARLLTSAVRGNFERHPMGQEGLQALLHSR